jgi:predicted branched-subunit amino acid permease
VVPEEWNLEFAIPILFIGLLVVGTETWPEVIAALAGAAVTYLVAGLPNRTGLLVGSVAGVAAGTIAERIRRD